MRQADIDRIQHEWLLSHVVGDCLHVGCGTKPIPDALNVDPNPDRAEWADETWDAHDLPVADESFDSVVSCHVLQALRGPIIALREMTRVLKPGGHMAHVVPDHRYAPLKRNMRYPFQYMHNEWLGPGEFAPLVRQVEGLMLIECCEFDEFDWSFKVVALKLFPCSGEV